MNLFRRFFFIYAILVIALSLPVFLPAYFYCLASNGRFSTAHQLRRIHTRFVFFCCCIRPVVFNREHIPRETPVLYCPNHTSYLDVLLCVAVLPGNFGFVGKEELLSNPVLRIFFGKTDISVKRGSLKNSKLAYDKAAGFLKKGWSIVIFPEGGISDTAPVMSKFKPGLFRLAMESGKPVVPVSIPDNYRLMPEGKMMLRPGRPRIYILPPILPENISDADKLKNMTHELLSSHLEEKIK